jgi:acetyl esterase
MSTRTDKNRQMSDGHGSTELAPESESILDRMRELGLLDWPTGTPAELRALSRAEAEALIAPPREVGAVEELMIEGGGPGVEIAIRLYRPPGGAERAILWLHGGGWVIGDLDGADSACRALCLDAAAVVASVGYRLAPEHPFPAGLDDGLAALRWFDAHLGGEDRELPLLVGGDSAGGNLSAALCMVARERGGPRIDRQLLIYPVTDTDFGRGSFQEFAEGYGLTAEIMRWFWEQYVGALREGVDERATVLRAGDLRGLPPATVVIAGSDVLRDEGEAYATRLAEADVPVDVLHYPGQMHGFWLYSACSDIQRRVNAEICASLADDS